MKNFRKIKGGLFVCKECGRLCKNLCSLGTHISKTHNILPKQYYDKWIREKDEGYCKECGKETSFNKLGGGYSEYCSTKCMANSKEIRQKYKDTCLQKYDVENTYQSPEKIKKIKQTWMENYGVENPYQAQTVKDKIKQNNIDKYGVEYSWQREDVKNNIKRANMKTYGVEYSQQRPDIHLKIQKHAFGARLYKNTDIYYRGTFELDFLEKYFNLFSDIINGPTIKYVFEGKTRIYFPDFYIPSLNLIVECKNSYLNERDKIIIHKKKIATIKQGYKYCIIINKNYDSFNKLIDQL